MQYWCRQNQVEYSAGEAHVQDGRPIGSLLMSQPVYPDERWFGKSEQPG